MVDIDEFKNIVSEKYEPLGYTIKSLGYYNVLLLEKGDEKLVAKAIFHIEGDPDLGPEKMDIAYNNEKKILQMLPDWWGLTIVDSFRYPNFRVIVTKYIDNCPWRKYANNSHISKEIAQQLWEQLNWMYTNKVFHNDLELKNILITCDYKKATIIDFEKATFGKGAPDMPPDIDKAIMIFEEFEHLKQIAYWLKKLAVRRRHSVGGGKRYTRKYKKRTKRTTRVRN